MLEMLRERKAALEAQGKKGFTLMEMLIVIAIIAILIAIAIPIFTAQLERSRDSVSISNMRSAYAEAAAQYLVWDGVTAYSQPSGSSVTSISQSGDTVTITVEGVSIETQVDDNWNGLDTEAPFDVFADPGTPTRDGTATFTYNTSTGDWELTGVA